MVFKSFTDVFSTRTFWYGLLIEILTIPIVVSTLGHAGPEGPLALLGWIGLVPNLPGVMIAVIFNASNKVNFAIYIFIIQMVIIMSVIYFYKILKNEKMNILK